MNKLVKWTAISVGGIVAFAHIGVLGHLMNYKPQYPVINFPTGKYSSYKIESGKDGYKIEYRANDPRVLESVLQHHSRQKNLSAHTLRGLERRLLTIS
jgi:hypothetical protein